MTFQFHVSLFLEIMYTVCQASHILPDYFASIVVRNFSSEIWFSFKINFLPKIPKIRFINFKIVFLKMQFFLQPISKYPNLAIFALFGLLFFFMFVKHSSTTYLTISKLTFADLGSLFMERITYILFLEVQIFTYILFLVYEFIV